MNNLDPIESSEIMELLRANYIDLDDPKRHKMIMDIVSYFSGREDKRATILKIISGNSGDGIDIVWNWVQLTQERNNKIKGLPKEQFTEDIQKEIEKEYLTRDNIKILKSQLNKRLEEREDNIKQNRSEEEKYTKKGKKATEKALNISELQNIQKKVEEIEQINQELDKY